MVAERSTRIRAMLPHPIGIGGATTGMKTEYELVRGPLDGGRVKLFGPDMPKTIYVAKKAAGDKYAAYGTEQCARFPVCYVLIGSKFVHRSFS